MDFADTQGECLARMQDTTHYGSQSVHGHGLAARHHFLAITETLAGKRPDLYGLPP